MRDYPLRASCRDYQDGFCKFYSEDCFYEDDNPLGFRRCNRLIPLEHDELMEWMDPINCSDCNEPICNDCDIYMGFQDGKADPHTSYI